VNTTVDSQQTPVLTVNITVNSQQTPVLTVNITVRVHEIAYGIGGPSEKNVSPHQFSIAKYQSCVSP
jgi:hypothetical protein